MEDEIKRRIAQAFVDPLKGLKEDSRQSPALLLFSRLKTGFMDLGYDPGLEGEPGCVWGKGREMLVLRNDTLTVVQFLLDNITIDTPVPVGIVFFRTFYLFCDPFRRDR